MAEKRPAAGLLEAVKGALKSVSEQRKERESHEYDGVTGKLPGWVPENFVNGFHEAGGYLVNTYSHKQALEWLSIWRAGGKHEIKEVARTNPGTGQSVTLKRVSRDPRDQVPRPIQDHIDFLARIQLAVEMGEKEGASEGMRMLAGNFAAQGLALWSASKSGRKDTLRQLMEQTYRKLKEATGSEPTNMEILQNLHLFDAPDEWHQVVQEIDYDRRKILWIDRKGKEKSTSFATFNDRMTRIRKMFSD